MEMKRFVGYKKSDLPGSPRRYFSAWHRGSHRRQPPVAPDPKRQNDCPPRIRLQTPHRQAPCHHLPRSSFSKIKPSKGKTREYQKHTIRSTTGARLHGPAPGPSTQASLLPRWPHANAQHSPASLLAFISGKVPTLGVFRVPAAPDPN